MKYFNSFKLNIIKTVVITSGYFNPIHPGHIDCLEMSKDLGDELWVIVNSDHQAFLKRGIPSFQDEAFRMRVVGALRCVNKVVLACDEDGSVSKTLEKTILEIQKNYGQDTKIIFTKGGDRFAGNIPEVEICNRLGIEIRDGLGAKTHNSKDYITRTTESSELKFITNEEALEFLKELVNTYTIIDAQIRLWGCFVALDPKDQEKFIKEFFPGNFKTPGEHSLTPKLLCVAPQKKLSWQYHNRRAELWTLIKGKALVSISETDEQSTPLPIKKGEIIRIEKNYRHRLIGDSERGIVAEIWEHDNSQHLSDENDIIRLEDDWKRN